jgi:AraC-like DNA-binding protein
MSPRKVVSPVAGNPITPFAWESEECQYQSVCPELTWKQPQFGKRNFEKLVQELQAAQTELCLTCTNTRNVSKLIRDGLLRPLNDVLPSSDSRAYFKPVMDLCSHQGILYAIPEDFTPYILIVRRDALKKYGFKLPRTWKELNAQAKVIFKDHEGPMIAPLGGKRYSPRSFLSALLLSNGLTEERAIQEAWRNESIYLEAYQWVHHLIKNDWLDLRSIESDAFRTEDFFESNKWVYRFCWLAELRTKPAAFWKNVLIAPFPSGPSSQKPTIFIHSRAWIIPQNSVAAEAGIQALRRISSRSTVAQIEGIGGQPFHARQDVWKISKVVRAQPCYRQANIFTKQHSYSVVQTKNPSRLAFDFVRSLQVGETAQEWLSKAARKPVQDVDGVVKRTVRYIQSHLSERMTIGKVSKALGKSERHLRRLFKQEMHITATDYIENIKMEKARELLTSTSLSVKEVASKVGFNHDWAFTRAFKRRCQRLPSSLRRTRK